MVMRIGLISGSAVERLARPLFARRPRIYIFWFDLAVRGKGG